MLNIAIRAAHAAGDHIIRYVDRIEGMEVDTKGKNDFVTEVDRQAESIIIDQLKSAYPDHAILAEESGKTGESEYTWVIDPLDGTTNFLHGFPQYAVSIALLHRGVPDQAVVYDPLKQELFTASKGAGAQLNKRRIRVSRQKRLEAALIGTGFPFGKMERLEQYLDNFRAICPVTSGIRRAGSASLDLAYVASGRLDGFWEYDLKTWDIAAGVLLVLEAGGAVVDMQGKEDYLDSGNIIAASPSLTGELLKILRQ